MCMAAVWARVKYSVILCTYISVQEDAALLISLHYVRK